MCVIVSDNLLKAGRLNLNLYFTTDTRAEIIKYNNMGRSVSKGLERVVLNSVRDIKRSFVSLTRYI